MADTLTTVLSLTKPEVTASNDTWGTKLNADLDAIDALFDTGQYLKLAKGGTGAGTAAGARTNLGAAASGAVTASNITMSTARILGRSTALTGAIEEIAIGTGLLLSAGTLSATVAAATTSLAGVVELATAAEYQSNSADRALTTNGVWSAAQPVALTWVSGGTTAVDFSAGFNFTVAAVTGNTTLGNPTNAKPGQSGWIKFTQDTSPRQVTFGSNWKFNGGLDPQLSTGSGAIDILYYNVIDASTIHASLNQDVK